MARRGWNIGLLGEAAALMVALFDRRTPWYAKLIAVLALGCIISPAGLIPFIGLVDDALIVPLGLWIASRFVPADVMDHARQRFSRRNFSAK